MRPLAGLALVSSPLQPPLCSITNKKTTVCVSPDRFLAVPARLSCLHHTFQSQWEGIFIRQCYWRVSGWLLWNYISAKTDSLSRFRPFRWQSFLIPVWVWQCGSSPRMWRESGFNLDALAKPERSMQAPRQGGFRPISPPPSSRISLVLR